MIKRSNFEKPLSVKPSVKGKAEESFEKRNLQATIELCLLKAEKVNEGNAGVIFKVDLSVLRPEEVKLLFPDFSKAKQDKAVAGKLIKVFVNLEQAEQEYKMQQRAYEVLSQYDESEVAQVPVPLRPYQGTIKSSELKEKMGLGEDTNPTVNIFFMDYIVGRDFATYIYEKVIEVKQRQSGGEFSGFGSNFKPEEADFKYTSLLNDVVGNHLGLTKIIGDTGENPESLKILDENEHKIIEFLNQELEKNDLLLDKSIFEKIKKAVDILHQHNIYHNDLHERNVMIDSAGRVFLIDFGKSLEKPDRDMVFSDESLVQKYSKLSLTKAEQQARRQASQNNVYLNALANIKSDENRLADFKDKVDRVEGSLIDEDSWLNLINIFPNLGNDDGLEATLILLLVFKQKPDLATKLPDFVTFVRTQKKVSASNKNIWSRLSEKIQSLTGIDNLDI